MATWALAPSGADPSQMSLARLRLANAGEGKGVRSATAAALSWCRARSPFQTAVATEAKAKGAKKSLISQAENPNKANCGATALSECRRGQIPSIYLITKLKNILKYNC